MPASSSTQHSCTLLSLLISWFYLWHSALPFTSQMVFEFSNSAFFFITICEASYFNNGQIWLLPHSSEHRFVKSLQNLSMLLSSTYNCIMFITQFCMTIGASFFFSYIMELLELWIHPPRKLFVCSLLCCCYMPADLILRCILSFWFDTFCDCQLLTRGKQI